MGRMCTRWRQEPNPQPWKYQENIQMSQRSYYYHFILSPSMQFLNQNIFIQYGDTFHEDFLQCKEACSNIFIGYVKQLVISSRYFIRHVRLQWISMANKMIHTEGKKNVLPWWKKTHFISYLHANCQI